MYHYTSNKSQFGEEQKVQADRGRTEQRTGGSPGQYIYLRTVFFPRKGRHSFWRNWTWVNEYLSGTKILEFLSCCVFFYLRPLIDDHFILCFCLLRRLLEGVLCPNSYNQARRCHGHQESGELMRWRPRGSRRVLGTRLREQRLQRGPRGYCGCRGDTPDRREVIVYLMLSVISRSLLAIWNLSICTI